ncbi:MAG: hypothetical protein ACQCN4_06260 [Candidatus Bathyarchaeia archaeon]
MMLYVKKLAITPTSVLSFRKLPMSHKTIASYSFIPPTVLSGFLYRLIRLSRGETLPTPKVFKNEEPVNSEYFILENYLTSPDTVGVFSLGAYPLYFANFSSFRMGYQDISLGITFASDLIPFRKKREDIATLLQNSDKFEKPEEILKEVDKSRNDYRYLKAIENIMAYFQNEGTLSEQVIPKITTYYKKMRRAPLQWEFTVSDNYFAYLVSKSKEKLSIFDSLNNYGYKIGKEGSAFISNISETQELNINTGKFRSSVVVPLEAGFYYPNLTKFEVLYFFNGKSFSRGLFAREGLEVTGDFLSTADGEVNIPKVTLAKLGVYDDF